ncbi:MAG: CoA transferase [Piscinibacter sp.]|nr:CoA transferase [Piscinibacter sp.]
MRVLDLTRLLPGPLATRHLAELGAEVIKIEGPQADGQGDGMRAIGRSAADDAAGRPSVGFQHLNEGKTLLELDLRADAGRARFLALAREADLVIEGFRPGVMARLGLGWDVLHAARPKLVMCAISGYGQSGAWAQKAGHDINYIAMAGVLEQIASVHGEPALPNFQIGDLMGGTQAALAGVLAALLAAQRSGQGRFVDISMTHQVWRHHVLARVALAATGRMPVPGRDLLSGGVPCYGVYRCADDRLLAVGALELKFWRALCEAIERPHWAAQHWSLGQAPGSPAALALRSELADLLATRTMAEWADRLEPVDCCVTPVLRLDELAAHPLYR